MQKTLYQRYAAKLLMVCLRYTKSKADAEDILQEGFIRIFKNLHQYNFKGSFEGWMKMIIVNSALESIRKKKMDFVDIQQAESVNQHISNYNAINNLAIKELLLLIQTLPNGCQIIFNLYVFDELRHKEISIKLNISESTSKSQLARARQLLQEKIEPQKVNNKKVFETNE